LHLSENPGITLELKTLLSDRVRCKGLTNSLSRLDIDSFSKNVHSILDKNASLKEKVSEGFDLADI